MDSVTADVTTEGLTHNHGDVREPGGSGVPRRTLEAGVAETRRVEVLEDLL